MFIHIYQHLSHLTFGFTSYGFSQRFHDNQPRTGTFYAYRPHMNLNYSVQRVNDLAFHCLFPVHVLLCHLDGLASTRVG